MKDAGGLKPLLRKKMGHQKHCPYVQCAEDWINPEEVDGEWEVIDTLRRRRGFLPSDALRASGGAAFSIRLRRSRSLHEVSASSRGRNQTSAEAEAAGLPAYNCAYRLGRALSKQAARRYLELLNGGDPSGSDKQIQVDL